MISYIQSMVFQVAVCNLASIALPRYVNRKERKFDFKKLVEVTGVIVRNLNKIIDINYYPVPEVRIGFRLWQYIICLKFV